VAESTVEKRKMQLQRFQEGGSWLRMKALIAKIEQSDNYDFLDSERA